VIREYATDGEAEAAFVTVASVMSVQPVDPQLP